MITPPTFYPPGEHIREELEVRGWSQADLAAVLGVSAKTVNEIIMAKRSITTETARALGEAFETGAEVWLRLESRYQLSKLREPTDAIARRAKLYSKAPVSELIRRGWLTESASLVDLEAQVCALLRINNLDEDPTASLRIAARATNSTSGDWTPAQLAWFFRARQLGEGVPTATKYSHKKLDAAIPKLRALLLDPEEARHVPRILSEAGVSLVIVEHLAGTKIDGVAVLDKKRPIVALSLRFDRIDYFWFTLLHELAHLRHEHASHLDQDLVGAGQVEGELAEWEQVANDFAAETLVPQDKLRSFINRVQPYFSRKKIEGFAAVNNVHPGIVLGQLKNRKAVPWRNLHTQHAKVRDIVASSAICDGWGHFMGVEE